MFLSNFSVLIFFFCGIYANHCIHEYNFCESQEMCVEDILAGVVFLYPNKCGVHVMNCISNKSNSKFLFNKFNFFLKLFFIGYKEVDYDYCTKYHCWH